MSSIGIMSFLTIEGEIYPSQPTFEELTRPGVDGRAFRFNGNKAEESELFCTSFAPGNASVADSYMTAYKNMAGTSQTIVHNGVTYTNMLILKYVPIRRKYVLSSAGGGWMIQSVFVVVMDS